MKKLIAIFVCLCLFSLNAAAADTTKLSPESAVATALTLIEAQSTVIATLQNQIKDEKKGHQDSSKVEPVSFQATAFWFSIISVTLFLIIGFSKLRSESVNFNLKEALSEEIAPPTGVELEKGQPIMVASASRLISYLGALVLIGLLIGFGYYLIWASFYKASIPDTKNISDFLLVGTGIFLPYAANKLSSAIKGQ